MEWRDGQWVKDLRIFRQLVSFARMWDRNIRDQGYLEALVAGRIEKRCVKCRARIPAPALSSQEEELCEFCGDDGPGQSAVPGRPGRAADVETVEAQLKRNNPNPGIVREALASLRSVAESMAASALWSTIQVKIATVLHQLPPTGLT